MLEKEILYISQKLAQEDEFEKNPSLAKELITRLKSLKKRVGEQRELEQMATKRAKTRISYLEELFDIPSVDSEAYDRWSKTRLNHMIVDYLARQGFSETALKLSQDANIEVESSFYIRIWWIWIYSHKLKEFKTLWLKKIALKRYSGALTISRI
jgi:hypothetical protein